MEVESSSSATSTREATETKERRILIVTCTLWNAGSFEPRTSMIHL
jgi:hypothetical protein